MKKLICLISVVLVIFFFSGCYFTQTPKPVSYRFSSQPKMQAAYHWELLAKDVAEQIQLMLKKEGYNLNQPVFVHPACGAPIGPCDVHYETPFGEGFYDLLITHLVNQNVNVSTVEDSALVVTNKVQVLYHRDKRSTRSLRPGFISALGGIATAWGWIIRDAHEYSGSSTEALAWGGAAMTAAGLYDITSGMFNSLPHSEVIITTSIRDYDRYLMRKTDIYYINDLDYWHYKVPPPPSMIEIRDS